MQNRERLLSPALDPRTRELRGRLLDLFDAALAAVDPALCTRKALWALTDQGVDLRQVTLFAFGKAARAMSEAALHELDVRQGMLIALDDAPLEPLHVARGGHPVPRDDAPEQGKRVLELARTLGPDDVALVLVSGGGSAMLELPVQGVALADLVTTTRALLASGASIGEINAVRSALSQLKGGKLAQAMPRTPIVNLLMSDVVDGALAAIASGPTLVPAADAPTALEVVARYGLALKLPQSVQQALCAPQVAAPVHAHVTSIVAADNATARAAMARYAREHGWPVVERSLAVVGEARDAALELLGEARATGALYVAGGETTVTLRASGHGGRNQELALAALPALDGATLGTLGTDGVDGSSEAAGAIADAAVHARAQALGLDLHAHLARHASGELFAACDAAIVTGPTGTNVADVVAIFPP